MPAVFVEAQELLGRVHTEELLSVITFNAERLNALCRLQSRSLKINLHGRIKPQKTKKPIGNTWKNNSTYFCYFFSLLPIAYNPTLDISSGSNSVNLGVCGWVLLVQQPPTRELLAASLALVFCLPFPSQMGWVEQTAEPELPLHAACSCTAWVAAAVTFKPFESAQSTSLEGDVAFTQVLHFCTSMAWTKSLMKWECWEGFYM